MRHYISCLLLIVLCGSCHKEVTTMDIVIVTNASNHPLTVCEHSYDEFTGSGVYCYDLAAGASKIDTVISGQDAAIHDPYRFVYIADSIRVIFDHRDSITHYAPQSETFAGRFYLFGSDRNLMNNSSYDKQAAKDKRQFQTFTYTYTFTPQDYEDAKK